MLEINNVYNMDAIKGLKLLDECSVDCCVTSPPYWGLRDYGVNGQIGLEETPEQFVENLIQVFREVKRVLKDDGTLWLNLGDSYAGGGNNRGNNSPMSNKQASNKGATGQCSDHAKNIRKIEGIKRKELIGIPWMVAFALRTDGWYLRQDIIWAKGNPMPESVKDRCTKSHEYIFLLSKNPKYYFDYKSIKEEATTKPIARNKNKEGYQADYPMGERFSKGERVYGADGMRNKRDVWFVNLKPCKEAHFATFPIDLIEPCILAGCKENGLVLDPFMGSGTTAVVSKKHNRNYVGFELNPEYVSIAEKRIKTLT